MRCSRPLEVVGDRVLFAWSHPTCTDPYRQENMVSHVVSDITMRRKCEGIIMCISTSDRD
ncbi:predicted protein [Plenodomus lingam JN3]|uniref:Predicted protein n=1 Tax=Leptosphaeria maculans (strain JN3 / isolate v23.1.3 / race Av1-4-5-6-7-8) TaxID=985895 RepID=E5R5C6_LEPMJ|nr:predicted protein [Plenodomus lingam JN3]CBX92096.1 predicted protein [Plenodomus lingam JN3]